MMRHLRLTFNTVSRTFIRQVSQQVSMSNRRIAVCQMTSGADKDANLKVVSELISDAVKDNVQMIFFPEACDFICDNKKDIVKFAEPVLIGNTVKRYRELAAKHNVWLSMGGVHELDEYDPTKMFNTHIIIDNKGEIVQTYRKLHLFDVEIPEKNVRLKESDFSHPGGHIVAPVETPAGRVGMAICYDMRFPELSTALSILRAEVLTYPSAFTQATGAAHWHVLLRSRAIENQCYVIAAAQTGKHNAKRSSYGHALCVNPWGEILADCGDSAPSYKVAEISLDAIADIRRNMPVFNHRRTNSSPGSSMESMQSLAHSLDFEAISEVISSVVYVPDQNPKSREGVKVDITHIYTPHHFYVRPIKFRMLIPSVQRFGEQLYDDSLFIGKTVVYKSKMKHDWIRGKIIKISSADNCMLYDLHTPDYGFVETMIKTKRIRTAVFMDVQPLAQRCVLAECNPRGEEFTSEAINAMKDYIADLPATAVVKMNTHEYLIVALITANLDNLALLMSLTDYTCCGYINDINRFYVPKSKPDDKTFTYCSLKAGDVLHVRIQSGKSFQGFYVADMDSYKEYINSRSDVTYFCKHLGKVDCKDLKEGKAVAVPNAVFDNMFERAIIKNFVTPDKVNVQLIDWGKTLEGVPVASLYIMSDKFFATPATAIYCSIEDDPGRIQLLPGYLFKVTVKKVGDKFNTPNIISPIV